MSEVELYDYQKNAVDKMKNGCILCGGVGCGKSRTSLAYFIKECGININEKTVKMNNPPPDLYIITTARKRDTMEWEEELTPFGLSTDKKKNHQFNTVTVDSWNNIKKYVGVVGAFFIFDEQRVCGYGAWAKSFIKITKNNRWILLSATPGDTWQDYIPVFIANGFYKNKSEFTREHIVFSRFSKYPKVDRYLGVGKLIKHRNDILINMDFKRKTISHHQDVWVTYNTNLYKNVGKDRWDPYKNEPIQNAAGLCYILRKVVNSDEARIRAVESIVNDKRKVIIFYNFDYELRLLKEVFEPLKDIFIAEWNGHLHQPIPDEKSWVYFVQYNAGAEGWNCITTDTIIFFSQNYSYKIMQQSAGRIDRLNTPYKDLYFYHLKSHSGIDMAISRALKQKKNFNESTYIKW